MLYRWRETQLVDMGLAVPYGQQAKQKVTPGDIQLMQRQGQWQDRDAVAKLVAERTQLIDKIATQIQ